MRILILGAGKMGSFFTDILSFQHETAVFDVNPHQLRFVYNTYRFTTLEEIKEFEPELVITAVTVKYTLDAFFVELLQSCFYRGNITNDAVFGQYGQHFAKSVQRVLYCHGIYDQFGLKFLNLLQCGETICIQSPDVWPDFRQP